MKIIFTIIICKQMIAVIIDGNNLYFEDIYAHKYTELQIYNICNIDFSKYFKNNDDEDDDDDFMYRIHKGVLLHKTESIKEYFKKYIINEHKYLNIGDNDSKEYTDLYEESCLFIEVAIEELKQFEQKYKEWITIDKEIYYILHNIDKFTDKYFEFYYVVYINKCYYNKYINEYDSIEKMFLNIPIKYYRRIIKTFDERYVRNCLRDKYTDKEVILNNYEYIISKYNYEHNYKFVIDRLKDILKNMLNKL